MNGHICVGMEMTIHIQRWSNPLPHDGMSLQYIDNLKGGPIPCTLNSHPELELLCPGHGRVQQHTVREGVPGRHESPRTQGGPG
jgi:hypothetical protein